MDAVCELTAVKIVGLLHAVDNPHTHVILGPMQGVDITPFRAMQNRLRKPSNIRRPSVCLSRHSTAATASGENATVRRVGRRYRPTAALSSKYGQCRIDSQLDTDSFRSIQ